MIDRFRRFRSARADEDVRNFLRETMLGCEDFILPLFCVDGVKRREKISSMPGIYRLSTDFIISTIGPLVEKGLSSIILFGVPRSKGIPRAWDDSGIVQRCIPQIKRQFPAIEIITDVCICSYSNDGHCHVGDNDLTCRILAKIALSHAGAGADVVAPSAMMDGQVYYIKNALDKAGFKDVRIMSYAAKFASNYYGPFRNAADCSPKSGDRRDYQMDPSNADEAMEEIRADIEQGADSVIVKPALACLDIISRARQSFSSPVIAYNVSGEYRMLNDAVSAGYAQEQIVEETLVSMKRAGANRIISYFTEKMLDKYANINGRKKDNKVYDYY